MKRRHRGFTLLELIIVVGILGVVMTITSSFFFSGYFNMNKTEKKLDLQRSMQSIVRELEEVIKASIEIDTIEENRTKIYGFISNVKENNEIKSKSFIYYKDADSKLKGNSKIYDGLKSLVDYMKSLYEPSINKVICDNVEIFEIVKSGNSDFLEVKIILKDTFRGEEIREEYSGRIYMRNQKDK